MTKSNTPGLRALVNLKALESNLTWLKKEVAPAQIFMVIKANANGHGTLRVAQTAYACGIHSFAVLLPEEAILIRHTLPPDTRIFTWHITHENPLDLIENRIEIGVGSVWHLKKVASYVENAIASGVSCKPAAVHLKLDTGLSRNGIHPEDWQGALRLAKNFQSRGFIRIAGFWSHLSNTSLDEDRHSLEIFKANVMPYVREYKGCGGHNNNRIGRDKNGDESQSGQLIMHIAASVAALNLPESRLDCIRLGLACFGYGSKNLKGVMTLIAPIIKFLDNKGDDPQRAIIAGGFADGISTLAIGSDIVLANRRKAKLIEVGPETSLIEIYSDYAAVMPSEKAKSEVTFKVKRSANLNLTELCAKPDNLQNVSGLANFFDTEENFAILFGSGQFSELTAKQWAERSRTTTDDVLSRVKAELIYLE